MSKPQIRSLVDGIFDAWNAWDMDRFIGYLDEGVVWDDPAMIDGPAVGHGAVRAFSESVLRAFPDFSYRIREPICIAESETRCVIPWEVQATHTGYLEPLGLAPTRQVIKIQGIDILELKGTKVTRIETLFNVVPAIEQALRLKPLSKNRLARTVAIWLQRCRAYWVRGTTKVEQ